MLTKTTDYFKRYIGMLIFIFLVLLAIAWVQSRPESVTLTSDKWECELSAPKGITTVCTRYTVKVKN